jgi:SAM-dependent methyltransferase
MTFDDIYPRARELGTLLERIDPGAFDDTPSFRSYFLSYRADIDYILQRYCRILSLACGGRPFERLSFLDYGGGVGILGLLARWCGIPSVAYLDISPEMVRGASLLAERCGIGIDDFLPGSYEEIESVCTRTFDVIANYDVLEHLYRPGEAFLKLKGILNGGGTIFMASGANTFNPVTSMLLRSFHQRCETQSEVGKPIMEMRRDIIRDAYPDLDGDAIAILAAGTRGKRKDDILQDVAEYRKSGRLPRPEDRTNTCDPLTGSGAENLIDVFGLQRELEGEFRSVTVGAGLYPRTSISFKAAAQEGRNIVTRVYPYLNLTAKAFAPLLNLLIETLPLRLGLALAPHYYVKADA